MLPRFNEGQLLAALFRWRFEMLHTHNPRKYQMIRRIILALEGL
jgi:hypothetical protein